MTVPPFRPYGGEDIRVVSDLSRFDYGEDQKIRSRNTTPTTTDMLIPDTDNASSSKLTLDTIIPLYSSKINEGVKYSPLKQKEDRSTQYPTPSPPPTQKPVETREEPIIIPKREKKKVKYSIAVQVPQDQVGYEPVPPALPPKDKSVPYPTNALPPMPQPTSQMFPQQQQQRPPPSFLLNSDGASILTPQQLLERELVKQVMNRPIIRFRADRFGEQYRGEYFSISANFALYVFEVCCSVVEIVLTSLLLQQDKDIDAGYYRYFLADGIISLVVSLLFALQVINYEVRNGSFYCLVSMICKFAAFIIVITHIFPSNVYPNQSVWSMRRGVGAIIIMSMFLWVTNMVMFVTTLYISRLDLLEELNFDYSKRGLNDEFNTLPAAPQPGAPAAPPTRQSSKRSRRRSHQEDEEPLKEFYLNENGEMYALTEDWEKEQHRGKNKILVYTF